jgi:NhaA family Na+:H+ antiporter
MLLSKLYKDFFNSEKIGGLLLIASTIVSMSLVNSWLRDAYLNFWHFSIAGHDLVHWINDGIMTLFFLLIGLELEREIYKGELSNVRVAILPIIAAIGGMAVPAGIYSLFNFGTPSQSGSGIPTATDIAFAIGILSLLGNRIPASLKIFLTAFAVIDDLGAIVIIAIFYTNSLVLSNLLAALAIFVLLLLLNRMKIMNLIPYLLGGVFIWYFMYASGVHPTITGILLAFAIPFKTGGSESPSTRLQHFLHKPVAYIVLPLFALADTAIPLSSSMAENLAGNVSLGIILGLLIGKPLGITLFSYLTVLAGLSKLPSELKWKHIIGIGFLGGIGFTMSIFITILAFPQLEAIHTAKLSIFIGSFLSGLTGFLWLWITLKKPVAS